MNHPTRVGVIDGVAHVEEAAEQLAQFQRAAAGVVPEVAAEIGLDEPGRDGVHAHAERPELAGPPPGELIKPALVKL